MATKNKIKYTETDKVIVEALKVNADGLTCGEISALTGVEVKAGHIVSAMNKGSIVKSAEDREVYKNGKREVSTYEFVTDAVLTKADGKNHNYTDSEKAILAAAKDLKGAFTLKTLAIAMGKDKLTSGSINGLVKKGNIVAGDKVKEDCVVKSTVGVYLFAKDIPADAE